MLKPWGFTPNPEKLLKKFHQNFNGKCATRISLMICEKVKYHFSAGNRRTAYGMADACGLFK